MSYPINYPTPQNANVQIFYRQGSSGETDSWVKPQGASFVWFTLIGGGGAGNGSFGGNSGNVTNFMCPAFLIPDVLGVVAGRGGASGIGTAGGSSQVFYQLQASTTSTYQLLRASGGTVNGGTNTANSSNSFTAMGFYQSILGDIGTASSITPSSTTFLSGGGLSSQTQESNYGYTTGTTGNRDGFFQMQPIIVGAGGMGTGNGGVGCGGGVDSGKGGDGIVVIITW